MEIDGKILIDHNSIGADDSGNGNHFQDENFVTADNSDSSQVWSELITGSPLDPKKAFNGKIAGNYADGCMPTAVNESCSIDFGDTFESADSVKLYFIRLQDVCELSVNGSSVTTQFDGSAINVFTETVDVSGTGLNTIFWNYVPSSGAPAYSYVSLLGIEVDGKLLIDATIRVDTVTDTPMRNYAVLETGTNGNLEGSGALTYTGEAGKTYYYETDGVGVTADAPVPDVGTGTHNFGQQPFAASNVTYDQDAGTVMLDVTPSSDPTIDDSQIWSDYVSINGSGEFSANRGPRNLFDGSTADPDANSCVYAGDNGRDNYAVWSSPTQFNNVNLRIFFECGNRGSTFIALDDNYYVQSTAIARQWVDFGTVSFNEIRWGNEPGTSENGAYMFAIEVDGKLLVDALYPGPYDTLYQTWEQYATYGLFFYNENTDEIIQKFTLQRRYGLTGAKPSAGIYELAVQPNFAVAAYIKEDETYVPIENPEPRIAAAEAQAAAEVAAAQAETRKYQRMLIRAACGWVLAKAYTAGDIIIYNGHVFRALEDNVATADNDPGDLDGTWEFLGLEEDAAPLAIDGYFPLYETEAVSDAAGNGSSHTHTIAGVTYYMPDGGVTIYHGNYTGFDY